VHNLFFPNPKVIWLNQPKEFALAMFFITCKKKKWTGSFGHLLQIVLKMPPVRCKTQPIWLQNTPQGDENRMLTHEHKRITKPL
jgi:hypothetical protein